VLSHHTPIGWNPNVFLKVGVAWSFSLWAITIVASTSSTTTEPRFVPATRLAGIPPTAANCAQTLRRVRARATWTFASRAAVSSSRQRHTVAGDATAPNTPCWWRSTSMSAIASPPPAIITATSVSTRPRS